MRNDTGTKDLIFREAFRLFMIKPYELVTICDLEKATKMTRGAIFYYAKNKNHLFQQVMKNYFLTSQNSFTKFGQDILKQDMTLLEFINFFIDCTEKTVEKTYTFAKMDTKDAQKSNPERYYLSLVLIAGHYMKKYDKAMAEINNTDKSIWSHFIQKAIDNGEIQQNTDVELYVELFFCIFRGKAFIDAQDKGLDVKKLKQLLLEVYYTKKI